MAVNPTIAEPSVPLGGLAAAETKEPLTPGQLVWRRFRKHRMAMIGGVGA
ncbi:MAG: hypothetical protein ACXWNQ_07555, partial [Anaerolineales bacterium]